MKESAHKWSRELTLALSEEAALQAHTIVVTTGKKDGSHILIKTVVPTMVNGMNDTVEEPVRYTLYEKHLERTTQELVNAIRGQVEPKWEVTEETIERDEGYITRLWVKPRPKYTITQDVFYLSQVHGR